MCLGVSRMDSEWRKTAKFIYGKVLEGSGKFRGCTEKVRNILEGVGPGDYEEAMMGPNVPVNGIVPYNPK